MEDIIDIIVTETTNLIEITSQPTDEVIDVNIIDNREDITLNVTPSVVEININSLTGNFGVEWGDITGTLSNQTDLNTALSLKADLVDGKVPSSQLPSYVDDIVEVANYASLPATGEVGKIYITLDTNFIYRWTGSTYVEIKDSSAVWGAITGTLSSQTDLQSALDAKLSTTTASSTYVPYTGATTNVDLGLRNFNANRIIAGTAITISDDSGIGVLNLKTATGGNGSAGGGYVGIASEASNALSLYFRIGFNNWIARLSGSSLSADRTYTLPDASGTIALTSQLHDAVTIGTANGLSLSTQVLSLGLASSSANGALSSTDWTTFNSKQAALSGTGFVKISGTTISYDNTSYLPLTGGTLTGTLNGTNITITNSLIAKGGTFNGGASYGGIVTIDGLGSDLLMNRANTSNGSSITLLTNAVEKWNIGLRSAGTTDNFFIYNSNLTANSLTINSSNSAATFASSVTATSHIVSGGTSSQFQKGDGSLDSNTYLTTSSASSAYLAKTGGTLTGALSGISATFSGSVHIGGSSPVLRLDVSGNSSDTATVGGATVEQVTIFRPSNGTGGIRTGFNTTSGDAYIWSSNSGSSLLLGVRSAPNNNVALTLASTGAATFSSSVTANSTNGIAGTFKSSTYFGSIDLENTGGDVAGKWNVQANSGAQVGGSSGSSFGIYSYGASAYRFWISSAGNVGIGTTSPSGRLHIINASGSGQPSLELEQQNSGSNILQWKGSAGTYLGVIQNNGNVGIGTTSPYTIASGYKALTIEDTSGGGIAMRASGTLYGLIYAATNELVINSAGGSGITTFYNAGSERMRITSGGTVLINRTADSLSTLGWTFSSGGGGNTAFAINNNEAFVYNNINSGTYYKVDFRTLGTSRGNVYVTDTGVTYNTTSDYRLKEDLKTINGLEILNKIKVYDYKWKSENSRMDGVLAHELAEVLPYAVQGVKDGEQMQQVDYSKIVPVMVQAIKDLKAKIETLENK